MQSLFEQIGDDFIYAGADNRHLVKTGESIIRFSGIEHGFHYHAIEGSRYFTKCLKHTFGDHQWKINFTIQAEKHLFIGMSSKEVFKSCEECIEKMLLVEQKLSQEMIKSLIKEDYSPIKDVPLDFILTPQPTNKISPRIRR